MQVNVHLREYSIDFVFAIDSNLILYEIFVKGEGPIKDLTLQNKIDDMKDMIHDHKQDAIDFSTYLERHFGPKLALDYYHQLKHLIGMNYSSMEDEVLCSCVGKIRSETFQSFSKLQKNTGAGLYCNDCKESMDALKVSFSELYWLGKRKEEWMEEVHQVLIEQLPTLLRGKSAKVSVQGIEQDCLYLKLSDYDESQFKNISKIVITFLRERFPEKMQFKVS